MSSFLTMFTAIVAFGNILVWGDDWRGMVLISLTLAFSAIMKYNKAEDHAKEIATNKSRSLEKAVDTVKMFAILSLEQLNKMTMILTNEPLKKTPPNEPEQTKETNTTDILPNNLKPEFQNIIQ